MTTSNRYSSRPAKAHGKDVPDGVLLSLQAA